MRSNLRIEQYQYFGVFPKTALTDGKLITTLDGASRAVPGTRTKALEQAPARVGATFAI